MDLRQLRYFVKVAEERHFGRAAQALHIAQPALTRQVRQLEDELGVQLFERHARGATPTSDAELLLERASFLLRYADQMRHDMVARQRHPQGTIAIGMSPGVALVLTAPLAAAVRERFPAVRLQIVELWADTLYSQLLQGRLDVGVMVGSSALPKLTTAELLTEQLCLIGPAGHPKLKGRQLRPQDLQGLPLILTGVAKGGVRGIVEAATSRADITLDGVIEVQSLEVAKRLVAEGFGLTVHFAAPIQPDLQAKALRAVPIQGLTQSRFLARASERPPSTAAGAIWSTLKDVVADLVKSGRWPNATLSRELKR
ncbi:LysR family transcriptional regulator [Ramlibacter sp. G-1-2-2]|uniref:LysR family transcriptional regulator n=1 Tax=Ramlibacter agri TaxID=2728837 RepID=A0A848H926_9BURK|nr:LysR substrate-binding domain-containing protein [Ramlibacter agri]NML44158.1 LysR family transcriptional regulator [Ramlibacter agri]